MLEILLANQEALIIDYQKKALDCVDVQKCNVWASTIKELILGYVKLLTKDQTVMALSQTDLDKVIASITDNGQALVKVAELEATIAANKAELEKLQSDDVVEDAAYEAKIAELTASLQADEAQLATIKGAIDASATPIV